MTRNQRRLSTSRLLGLLVYATAILALVPLSLVLGFTILKGFPALTHPEFFTTWSGLSASPGAASRTPSSEL